MSYLRTIYRRMLSSRVLRALLAESCVWITQPLPEAKPIAATDVSTWPSSWPGMHAQVHRTRLHGPANIYILHSLQPLPAWRDDGYSTGLLTVCNCNLPGSARMLLRLPNPYRMHNTLPIPASTGWEIRGRMWCRLSTRWERAAHERVNHPPCSLDRIIHMPLPTLCACTIVLAYMYTYAGGASTSSEPDCLIADWLFCTCSFGFTHTYGLRCTPSTCMTARYWP